MTRTRARHAIHALVASAAFMLLLVVDQASAQTPAAPAPPSVQKSGPPTETGFVVLAKDDSLLISSAPMGQAFAVPGGGTFVTEAPATTAKKPEGGRAGDAGGGAWVSAGGATQGTAGTAGASSAPPTGGRSMMMMTPVAGSGQPTLTRFVTNKATKGMELLKNGEKVVVQYALVNGDRVAILVSLPEKEKK